MRYLCVDLGDKRTGLALGDDETGLVSPVGVVETPFQNRDGVLLLEALGRAADEHLGMDPHREPGELVIGLPIHMSGEESHRSKLVRAFGARLSARCRRPIHFQDERLTSVQADWEMARTGMTHGQKKGKRDALAAAAILRDFLADRGVGDRPTQE
ncbi:MAG: Holliday junction resolvase RuvX [Planctomycetota bacterium]